MSCEPAESLRRRADELRVLLAAAVPRPLGRAFIFVLAFLQNPAKRRYTMVDALLDALVDTGKLLPILFLTCLL